jgi:2-oxoglutarate ferredoxin oxidoreductase subunit alpha
LPDIDSLPEIEPAFAVSSDTPFLPYSRDDDLARPWAIPGTPGLEHRIGGLERQDGTGNISYDPLNHERMTHLRADKVGRIASDVAPLQVDDPDGDAELLVLGWGSTAGTIRAACRRVRSRGRKVAAAHLRWVHPFPANTGDVLRGYRRVLIPEMNTGQLTMLVRAEFLVDAVPFAKVQGLPIWADELEQAIWEMLDE